MNRAIVSIYGWFEDHKNQFHDIGLLLVTVLFGTFIKVYKEPNSPNKWRFTRFLSELAVSFLIAITLCQINEIWLHFPKWFVMTLCAWGGSMSGKIYKEVDEFLSSIFESLKTFISNRLQTIIILLSIGLFFVSCKSQKPILTSNDKQTIIQSEVSKDKQVIKNLAVLDSLKTVIEKVITARPECDSITNTKIDEILSRINTQKTSGNNSYGFYFDKLKRELVAYVKMGETKDEKIQNNYITQKTMIEKQRIEVPIKYIPKWLQYLAWMGGLLIVYNFYKIILWVQRKSSPLV